MSCDRFTGVRRLIGLYLEKLAQHGDDCAATLSDVLPVQNIEVVANLDLLAEYDPKPHRDTLRHSSGNGSPRAERRCGNDRYRLGPRPRRRTKTCACSLMRSKPLAPEPSSARRSAAFAPSDRSSPNRWRRSARAMSSSSPSWIGSAARSASCSNCSITSTKRERHSSHSAIRCSIPPARRAACWCLVLAAIAEFERELIRERTSAGRNQAKANGVRFGRTPKLTPHQRAEALQRRRAGEALLTGLDSRLGTRTIEDYRRGDAEQPG